MTKPVQTFVPKISADVPWETAHHITLLYQKINGIASAVVNAHTASTNTTTIERITSGGGGGGGGSSPTIGTVNDQSGHTAYTTMPTDYGAVIILNDASPIAVTLGVSASIPWFCWMANLGAGTATLTPVSGTVNGGASFALLQNYAVVVAFDGANFWAVGKQLSFADISGVATTAQIGTGTPSAGQYVDGGTGAWTTLPASGVSQIVAGTNVTISPVGGTGVVTINASGGGTTNFADDETPSGLINSSNVTYTLAHTPSPAGSLELFLNGLVQSQGVDYTLTSATITFAIAPVTGSTLLAWYRF